jgi:hypothetical protein
LNGNLDNKFKIRPPGAMHQARWMNRAIYCLKIYIFRNQYSLSTSEKNAIRDIYGKEIACSLNVVNDTAERAVKLMEDFHGTLTKDDKKSELLLQCIQEHRRLYPDCKKETLKKQF